MAYPGTFGNVSKTYMQAIERLAEKYGCVISYEHLGPSTTELTLRYGNGGPGSAEGLDLVDWLIITIFMQGFNHKIKTSHQQLDPSLIECGCTWKLTLRGAYSDK